MCLYVVCLHAMSLSIVCLRAMSLPRYILATTATGRAAPREKVTIDALLGSVMEGVRCVLACECVYVRAQVRDVLLRCTCRSFLCAYSLIRSVGFVNGVDHSSQGTLRHPSDAMCTSCTPPRHVVHTTCMHGLCDHISRSPHLTSHSPTPTHPVLSPISPVPFQVHNAMIWTHCTASATTCS